MARTKNTRTVPSETARTEEIVTKRRCCCHPCVVVLIMIVLVVAGGILIWQLLPSQHKQDLKGALQGGSSNLPGLSESNLPPPPTFNFYRCGSETNCCNGIDTICDLRVSQIMFAGVHNAMSSVEDGFLFAGNNEYQLESALQAGYRGINVDVGNCQGKLVLVHTKCELGTRDPYLVFSNINLFLESHPRDLILLPLQINNDVDLQVNLWDLYGIMNSIPGFTDRMYSHNQTFLWPTMRSLIDNDKRIICFFYNANTNCENPGDCPPGFNPYFRYVAETIYTFATVADIQNTQLSCPMDRGASAYHDFYVLNDMVSDPLPSKTAAEIVNQKDFLLTHIAQCAKIAKQAVNMVFVDFWDQGGLVDVVQDHNARLGANAARKRHLMDELE